jgi:hypothetical protein
VRFEIFAAVRTMMMMMMFWILAPSVAANILDKHTVFIFRIEGLNHFSPEDFSSHPCALYDRHISFESNNIW